MGVYQEKKTHHFWTISNKICRCGASGWNLKLETGISTFLGNTSTYISTTYQSSTVYVLFYCQIEPEFQLQHKAPWTFSIVFFWFFWYNFRLYQKADQMVKLTLTLKPVNANHIRWSTFPLFGLCRLLNHVIQLKLRKKITVM